MSSVEGDDGGGELDSGEKVALGLVVTGGAGAELLEFAEEILDQIPCLIVVAIVLPLLLAIALGWDDGGLARRLEREQDAGVRVVAAVGDEQRCGERRQQHVGPGQLRRLAAAEPEARRVAERIHRRVNLGAQPAPTPPERLVAGAPFLRAPALCWCAMSRARHGSPVVLPKSALALTETVAAQNVTRPTAAVRIQA